jgi:hypothetical protein
MRTSTSLILVHPSDTDILKSVSNHDDSVRITGMVLQRKVRSVL